MRSKEHRGAKWRNKIVAAAAVVVAQSLSCVWLFATPWTATRQASLSFTISWSLLKLMSIESVMVMLSDHLVLYRPLLLLPSISASIRAFSTELALHIKWSKYWSFSFSISPSNEYSGLISFRIVWFDVLTVQGTLKSLLQRHSSKPSILWHSAFFMVQLSHPYVTTQKKHTFDYMELCQQSKKGCFICWESYHITFLIGNYQSPSIM